MIKQYKTDSTILLSGMRDGMPIDMNITLSKRPPPSNELPKLKDKKFEFTIREISFADRVNARLEIDHGGLVVETVEPAGWAALAGLRQGDLLLGIDQISINTILDYQNLIEKKVNQRPEKIIFFIRRGIHTMYLEVQPDWKDS